MSSGSLLARARRLTDTQIPAATAKLGHQLAAGDHGAPAGGISATSSCHQPELVSVVSCYGGGLEANKTATVGGLRVTFSVHTQAGADPGGNVKENQDAWCVQERLAGHNMALFGVFDGHGQEGKAVSNCVCQNLPKGLAKLGTCKPATLEAALASAFPEANRVVKKQPGLDADLSGSTGIVAVLTPTKLVVANLGDSRCVLGKVDVRGGVSAVALSTDHTPMDPAESERIIASGGRIASFMCGSEPLGPPRVWLRDVPVPGLCMTRSFGDLVAASVGVIDDPQVVTAALRPEDKYVVLMSDGIFEFLDSQAVLEEVHRAAQAGQSPNEAAKRLIRMARLCWQEQEEEIIDDCTAMVLYLAPAAAAAATSAAAATAAATVGGGSAAGGTAGAAAAAAAGLAARLDAGLRIKSSSGAGGSSNGSSGGGAHAAGAAPAKAAAGALGHHKRG